MAVVVLPPIPDRAAAGAAWLDVCEPGWAALADAETLTVSPARLGVLDQLYTRIDPADPIGHALRQRRLRGGFVLLAAEGEPGSYQELTAAWQTEIRRRRPDTRDPRIQVWRRTWRGAALLDRCAPGWATQVEVDPLRVNLYDLPCGILQVYGSDTAATIARDLGPHPLPAAYGCNRDDPAAASDELTRAWKFEVYRRSVPRLVRLLHALSGRWRSDLRAVLTDPTVAAGVKGVTDTCTVVAEPGPARGVWAHPVIGVLLHRSELDLDAVTRGELTPDQFQQAAETVPSWDATAAALMRAIDEFAVVMTDRSGSFLYERTFRGELLELLAATDPEGPAAALGALAASVTNGSARPTPTPGGARR